MTGCGAQPTWTRHAPARTYCLVIERGASIVTACNGRWPVADAVEQSAAPDHDDKCEACERIRLDRVRIEAGLCEIREATVEDLAALRRQGL